MAVVFATEEASANAIIFLFIISFFITGAKVLLFPDTQNPYLLGIPPAIGFNGKPNIRHQQDVAYII